MAGDLGLVLRTLDSLPGLRRLALHAAPGQGAPLPFRLELLPLTMWGAIFTHFAQTNFAFHSDKHAINPTERSNVLSSLSLDYTCG